MYSHVLNYRTWSLSIISCGSIPPLFSTNEKPFATVSPNKYVVMNLFYLKPDVIYCLSLYNAGRCIQAEIILDRLVQQSSKSSLTKITLMCINIKSLGIWKFLHITEAHQYCLTGYRISQYIIFLKNLLSWLFPGLNL